ncbi:MAG: hypothetical protein Q9163_005541, partial [Psora crenata]
MSQNFRHPDGASHRSPPNRPNTGVEGLMSSLISPGPGTPMQGPFQMPWLGMQHWQNGTPGIIGASLQDQMQTQNHTSFDHNNEEDYEPAYETPKEPAAGGTNAITTGQDIEGSYDGGALSLRTLLPKLHTPLSAPYNPQPQLEPATRTSAGTSSTPNAAENAKKLSELRAKLLAKKSKGSREASPAAAGKGSPRTTRGTLTASPSAENGARTPQAKSAMGTRTASAQLTPQMVNINPSNGTSAEGIITDLDNLFAEVRNGTNDVSTEPAPPSGVDAAETGHKSARPTDGTVATGPAKPGQETALVKRLSSSELSDGEIRSDEEQPVLLQKSPTVTKALGPRKGSQESEEKSRRETEVEAAYQTPSASNKDSQEKLRRQSQVQLTYSPLRGTSASMSKKPPDMISAARAGSSNPPKSPKSISETPSRPWITQSKGRAGDYDSYVPPQRDSRKSSINEPTSSLGKRTSAGERVDAENRRRTVEENSKAAAAYKKTLENRAQPRRDTSAAETTYIGRSTEPTDAPAQAEGGQRQSSALISPTEDITSDDRDLADWLELTEYHDEGYRKGRLARFRKKKQLEKLRLELEQEEQLELQQRSLFRSSILPTDKTPQKITKMAPPSLPLREANGNNEPLKATALAAAPLESQVGTPTLKRQHAEDDTDARRMQPMDKIARVDSNASASRFALRSETSPTFPAPVALEHRISRDDGHLTRPYRPRSRSSDR